MTDAVKKFAQLHALIDGASGCLLNFTERYHHRSEQLFGQILARRIEFGRALEASSSGSEQLVPTIDGELDLQARNVYLLYHALIARFLSALAQNLQSAAMEFA